MTETARQHAIGTLTTARTLTARQTAFVAAFAQDSGRAGAAAAAREAGYPARSSHIRGHRLLRTDYILAAIAHQPGGAAALEHLAASARSRYIATLARIVLDDDGATIRILHHGENPLALMDKTAAAARGCAIKHGMELAERSSAIPDGKAPLPGDLPRSTHQPTHQKRY